MKYLAVFSLVFLLDLVWAWYTKAIQHDRRLVAALHAAVIYLISGSAIVMYNHDPHLLLPGAAGAFIGTWTAIWWSKWNP